MSFLLSKRQTKEGALKNKTCRKTSAVNVSASSVTLVRKMPCFSGLREKHKKTHFHVLSPKNCPIKKGPCPDGTCRGSQPSRFSWLERSSWGNWTGFLCVLHVWEAGRLQRSRTRPVASTSSPRLMVPIVFHYLSFCAITYRRHRDQPWKTWWLLHITLQLLLHQTASRGFWDDTNASMFLPPHERGRHRSWDPHVALFVTLVFCSSVPSFRCSALHFTPGGATPLNAVSRGEVPSLNFTLTLTE